MAVLVQDKTGQRRTLRASNLVGRSSKCELHLPNPNVSAEHAVLWWDGGSWWIKDNNSRNGTSIDGRPLVGDQPMRLQPDMTLTFAQQLPWKVESIGPPAAAGVPIVTEPMATGPVLQASHSTDPSARARGVSGPISSPSLVVDREQLRRLLVSNVRIIENPGATYDIVFDLSWREAFRYGDFWNAAWVFFKYNAAVVNNVSDQKSLVNRLVEENAEGSEVATRLAAAKDTAHRVFDLINKRPQRDAGASRHPPNLNLAQSIIDRFEEPVEPSREIRLERSMIQQGQEIEVETDFAFLTVNDDAPATLTTFTHWLHMKVSPNARDHGHRRGIVIDPAEDGLGVFIHLDHNQIAHDGGPPLMLRDIRVRTQVPCKSTPLKVWAAALEMVLIPEGDFHLGDPKGAKGPTSCFYSARSSEEDRSFVVSSEDTIPVGNSPGELTWDNRKQMGQHGDIPAEFPKGHQGFYILKHQVTQGEYCDFLNHLQSHQLTIRYPYGGQGDYRYTVFKTTTRTRVCTRPERACNWVSWADAAAYIWWAGLRPMTEFEYEKACRGTEAPLHGEYAWGSTTLFETNVIVGDESRRPIVQGNSNIGGPLRHFAGGDGGQGPVPDDAFRVTGFQPPAEAIWPVDRARESYTWREETGGSFYRVMGLTGNLWEYVVTAGTDEGRSFRGDYGTGNLHKSTGAPDEPSSWPGHDNLGVGFRGGSWYTIVESGQVANRRFGSGLIGFSDRGHDTGIRAVRTAPKRRS